MSMVLPPPNQQTAWDHVKYKVAALILVGIIAGAVALSALAYQRVFTSAIPIVLRADRAGLQMHAGNRVKVQGVDLGRVADIQFGPDENSVDITLAVDPRLAEQIPVNIQVDLNQLTAFGNKSVDMSWPANPSPEKLHAGSTIQVHHVAGEINGTFEQLMRVLNDVQPAKLNAMAGALAETLQDKGDSLGTTIRKGNAYLKKFNTDLPGLRRDWRQIAGFASVYGDSANDIVNLVSNAGVVSTIFSEGDWPGVLKGVDSFSDRAEPFFDTNAHGLNDALDSVRPITSLLKKYSPALTCFLDGAAETLNKHVSTAFGRSGVQFDASPVLAPPTYHYPEDLPKVGTGLIPPVPDCHGLPTITPDEYWMTDATNGPASLAPGTQPNGPRLSKTPALMQFFGPRAYTSMLKGKGR